MEFEVIISLEGLISIKKKLLSIATALVVSFAPDMTFAASTPLTTTSPVIPLSDFSHAKQSASFNLIVSETRGSEGPYYVSGVSSGYAEAFATATTLAGGISVGGYFAGGGQIIVVNQNNGAQYSGPVVSGTVSALNDYVNCPSGTYTIYIGNPTSTTQSYGPLTVYYN